jgi:hypothetical protein
MVDVLKHFVACSCIGVLMAASAMAAPQGETTISQITLQGTVEAVDHVGRTVRIRGQQGNVVTLDVPATVARFDQVKVGDTITATYYDRVSIRVKSATEPDVDRVVEPTTTTTPGALPGAAVTRQRVTTVRITAWDPATRMVSFTGPKGTSYTRRVSETLDPTVLAGLKVGDRVDVTRTEASQISMQFGLATPAAAAAPAQIVSDPLEHRFTVSVQYGPDNSFSGDVIQAATGQTLSGIPINLNDTSYDDIYGRMDVFKVGIGYRTTPRSEVLVNFVIARSGSQTVDIGTVGAAGTVPLNVDFGDYNYWGFEGGQRVYFTRARITPFIGYLVGVQRYDDIDATFVNATPGLTPGLAAEDGKFFEKSWAFNVGPTGGFLVGLGPVEAMVELQLKYTGGLSDVDWLVEEGLRDINDSSSRWSLPILFGARFRF